MQNPNITDKDVLNGVIQSISEALFLDAGVVTSDKKIKDELGATSIDFLDIMFQLEKVFGITLNREDFQMKGNHFDNMTVSHLAETVLVKLASQPGKKA